MLLPIPGEPTRVDAVTLAAGFDAADGNAWTGTFRIEGLDRPGFTAETLLLDGGGAIGGAGGFTVGLDFAAEALDLGDPAAGAALGERVTGRIDLVREPDAPLRIARFDLSGETYAFESAGTLDIADRDLAVDGRARVSAEDLSVFSGLCAAPPRGVGGTGAVGAGRHPRRDLRRRGDRTDHRPLRRHSAAGQHRSRHDPAVDQRRKGSRGSHPPQPAPRLSSRAPDRRGRPAERGHAAQRLGRARRRDAGPAGARRPPQLLADRRG